MRRWDGLVEGYTNECTVRGLAAVTVDMRRRELDRCGTWLKHRRPRVNVEQLDSELLIPAGTQQFPLEGDRGWGRQ